MFNQQASVMQMALKAVLTEDEFGELDETTAGFYEWDGEGQRYRLSVDDIDSHPEVNKLRSSHQRSKREREEARKKAQDLERRFGKLAEVDPEIDLQDADDETVQRALSILKGEEAADSQDGQDAKNGKGKGPDLDKIKDQARKPVERERDEIAKERDSLRDQLNNMVVDNALQAGLSEIQVQGPFFKYLQQAFRNKVRVDDDDDGNPVAVIDGEYGEQPVTKYLREWAQTDEGRAFVYGNNGGGAPGSRGGKNSGPNPWKSDQWNRTEQARIAREEPERAKRMAEAAGKTPPRV